MLAQDNRSFCLVFSMQQSFLLLYLEQFISDMRNENREVRMNVFFLVQILEVVVLQNAPWRLSRRVNGTS